MGLIQKIPGGRPPKDRVAATPATTVEQARVVVVSEHAEIPPTPMEPWQDQTHAEKLDTLAGMALDKTREILELPCDPENLKLLSIQKDAALSVLSTQVRVDENRLRQQGKSDRIGELLRELEAVEADHMRQ